jgi:hypothetical protein
MKLVTIAPILTLSATLAVAQEGFIPSQQQDTALVGITAGQSARLNVIYPTIPAPVAQVGCGVSLVIADDQGKILKFQNFVLNGGHGASISINSDLDGPPNGRMQIHGYTNTATTSAAPASFCTVIPSLDVIDNITGKTVVHLETQVTFPRPTISVSTAAGKS